MMVACGKKDAGLSLLTPFYRFNYKFVNGYEK